MAFMISELPTYRFQLDNGMTLILREDHSKPVIALNFFVKAGSKYEKNELVGISHYLEHMFYRGSKNFPRLANHNNIFNVGGISGACTSYDWTMFYNVVCPENFDTALECIADPLQTLTLADEEFNIEKNVIKEEISKFIDNPYNFGLQEFINLIFAPHHYTRPIMGNQKSLETITRDSVLNYYKTYYVPNNIVGVIVGDFKADNILDKVKAEFDGFKPNKINFPLINVSENLIGFKEATFRKSINEALLFMGFRIPGINSPDRYALDVLMSILNDGENSAFHKNLIISKKSAVSISTFSLNLKDHDVFCIKATPFEPRKIDTLKKEIINILIGTKEKGFSPKDLRKAIEVIKFKTLKKKENFLEQATALGASEINGGLEYELNYLNNIENVTLNDLRKVANDYFFNNNMCIVEILPEKLAKIEDNSYKDPQSNLGNRSALVKFNFKEELYPKKEILSKGEPTYTVLPSGLRLIIEENPTLPLVSLGIYIKYGAMHDNPPKMGTANLLMNLLKTNTINRQYDQIIEDISELGNDYGINIDHDYSSIIFTFLAEKTDKALALISDMITKPLFKKEYLDIEKHIALSNLQKEEDNLESFASQNFDRAIYSQHRYSRPILGELPSIKQVNIDDMNMNYSDYIIPSNLVITVVGDVNTDKIKQSLVECFSFENNINIITKTDPAANSIASRRGEILLHKDREQAYIIMGSLTAGIINEDYIPLVVLTQTINHRVFQNLIYDKTLAYKAYCQYRALKEAGSIAIHIATNPENVNNVKKEIKELFEKIIDDEVSDQELNNVKNSIIGNYFIKQQNNINKLEAMTFFEIIGLGYEFKDKYPKYIAEVSAKEVLRVAKKYIDIDKLTTIIVTPKQQKVK